jgi:UDP-N-acetylmuramoyl-tripeptide--D-alanyl-D-alanine ligase
MATSIPSNSAAFTVTELVSITGGRLLAPSSRSSVAGIGTDTRDVLAGKAFVALVGEQFDGHSFVAQAAEGGAALLIVSQPVSVPEGVGVLLVCDTLVALGEIAAHHRRRWGGRLVAIGGAAGKTTTRAATSALLSGVLPGKVHSTLGNLNNRVGVPMVLLGLQAHHSVAVVEVGTNELGEIPLLAKLCDAHLAVITLVDLEHTEGLGDLDGIEREEGALLEALAPDGIALVNGDDARAVSCLGRAGSNHRLRYGTGADCQYRLTTREPARSGGSTVHITLVAGRELTLTTGLVGLPGALAVTAAVAVVSQLVPDFEVDALQTALDTLGGGEGGRLQVRELPDGGVLVDDCYNANPGSMRSSISVAREIAAARGANLLLVLGEMRELGRLAQREHALLAQSLRQQDRLVAVGEQMLACVVEAAVKGVALRHEPHADSAIAAVNMLRQPGDVVLIKGSRGVRLERVAQALLAAEGVGK